MNLRGAFELVDAIDGVSANDDAVRDQFPGKFAAVRSLLKGGRLGRLRDLASNLKTLFELLVDPTFKVPWRTTAAIVAGLGYFLLSLDLIPDAIPVLGFLDDALVIAEVVYFVAGDLRRFREHRSTPRGATPARAEREPQDPPPPQAPASQRMVAA